MYMKRAEETLWRELFHIYTIGVHPKIISFIVRSSHFPFFLRHENPSSKAHSSNRELCYVLFYWTAYYGTVSRSYICCAVLILSPSWAFSSNFVHFCASGREKPWFFVHDEFSYILSSQKHELLRNSRFVLRSFATLHYRIQNIFRTISMISRIIRIYLCVRACKHIVTNQ